MDSETEEYESRGFPFRDFLLRLILIIIFIFLLIWLVPKFIAPKINSNSGNSKSSISNSDMKAVTSQIFLDNLEKMKNAAITYYTSERLPKEVGSYEKLTLEEMIEKKLIVPLIDKNNKECNKKASYVKITKLDEEYILKVNLKDSEKEDYILVHLGCYSYCKSYICEKKSTVTDVNIKSSKSQGTPINVPSDNGGDGGHDDNSGDTGDHPQEPQYLYQYAKTTGAEFSSWTKWSDWAKVDCSVEAYTCSDSDVTCLKQLKRYDRKEKVGTYMKEYVAYRDVIMQASSYQEKTCSNYNYVIINNVTYAYSTSEAYTANGSWTYVGRYKYKNPPKDEPGKHYVFVGADYSHCGETCTSLPYYWYDYYTYNAQLSAVSSVTSAPASVSASCESYVTKIVPIYRTISVPEIVSREEPLYGTVCYSSTKTRNLITEGKTITKWSTYNDLELLNNGWYYTGAVKQIN